MDEVELIRLEKVWKIYTLGKSKVYALRNVSLHINKKDFIAIMGPSGSGKSTLLYLLGLLDMPTKGDIFVDNINVTKLSSYQLAEIRNKKIGFIFQQFNLMPHLNALENVYLPILFSNRKNKENMKEKALELLRLVGLKGKEKHKPVEMSGGEQQRVAIARALINDPDIILADEPTGNLDSSTGKQIMEILVNLHKKHRKTIVVVTHDPLIARYAKKFLNIMDGVVRKDHEIAKKFLWELNERKIEKKEK
ncbi:MAG: ABC transporter ATP-binding protein [Candidatus Pacearchaeota archaeon]